MKAKSGRSPDLIFHGFGTALAGMGQLLDDLVASLLEVCFSMDFEEDPWLRHRGQVRVIPAFWPYYNNISWTLN